MELTRLHALDGSDNAPWHRQDYDWLAYGESDGQSALVAAISDPKRGRNLRIFNNLYA
jgi:hypothetical protein